MIEKLLSQNRAWAQSKQRADADFFTQLSSGQQPSVFWIGCCDSRVIPTEMFGLSLGDMFIHTNVANQVNADDANGMSALALAVHVLGVQDVVICGHTHCHGVASVISRASGAPEAAARWLAPLKELYHANQSELPPNNAANKARLERALSELNVLGQVKTTARLDLIGDAWKAGKKLDIHGWIFDLESGLVEEICRQTGA